MLMIESLSRGAIADAIYTIEQIQQIGSRAAALNEAIESGLLTESRTRLLMEDLDKAMGELQTQSQSSLDKLDKAVAFVENFLDIGKTGKGVPIWDLMTTSFGEAKSQLTALTTIELGTIGNIKAFFNEGGKLAAIMDALAAEMNLLSIYIKILSGAFSQTIRQMKALPATYKETGNKDQTLKQYLDSNENKPETGKKIDAKMFEGGLLDVMQDIQANNGGYTWSIKGIKNWFNDNKKGIGLAALGGGIAAIAGLATGGLALGPLAAMASTVGIGAGVAGGVAGAAGLAKGRGTGKSNRTPKNAPDAYGTSNEEIAEKLLESQVNKLEALIPAFVKAVKGVNPEEYQKASEEAKAALQYIQDGIDPADLIKQHIDKEPGKSGSIKLLNQIDSDKTKEIVVSVLGKAQGDKNAAIDKYKDTTIFNSLKMIQGELAESLSSNDDDILLEENELAHDSTMVELLFEKRKKKKRKGKKTRAKAKKDSKASKTSTDKKKKRGDKDKSSGVTKPEYKKFKGKIQKRGQKNLDKAERKPESAEAYAAAVDKLERKINKKMVNKDRKRNITKIADEFEKKIMALEDEKDTGTDAGKEEEKEDKEEKGSGALEMLGLEDKPEVAAVKKQVRQITNDLKAKIKSSLSEAVLREYAPLDTEEFLKSIIDNPEDETALQNLENGLEEAGVDEQDAEDITSDMQNATEEVAEIIDKSDLTDEEKEEQRDKAAEEVDKAAQEELEKKFAEKEKESGTEPEEKSGGKMGDYSELFKKGMPLASYELPKDKEGNIEKDQIDSKTADFLTALLGATKYKALIGESRKLTNETYDRRLLRLAGIK